MPRSTTARAMIKIVTAAGLSGLLVATVAITVPATAAGAAAQALAVPQPGSGSELRAVTCTSASNCWAVGNYGNGPVDASEALHCDGSV